MAVAPTKKQSQRRHKWIDVKIPAQIIESIDKFLESELAAKNGLYSRSDLIVRLLVAWFSSVEKDFSLFNSSRIPDTFSKTHPPPIQQHQIGTTKPEAFQILSRLVIAGYVDRRKDPETGELMYRISPKGEELLLSSTDNKEEEGQKERTITEILEEKRKRREEQEDAMIKMMEKEAKRFQNMSQQQVEDALNKMQKEANIQPPHSPRFIKKLAETLRKGGYVDYAGRELYFKAGQEVEPTEQEQK